MPKLAEDRDGAPVVVISHGLWQRRYGGDPSIIGRTLLMNDDRDEVIGVMPQRFVFRNRAIDYWIPINLSPEQAARRGSHYLNVVGRLKPGITKWRSSTRRWRASFSRANPHWAIGFNSASRPVLFNSLGPHSHLLSTVAVPNLKTN